MLFSFSRVACRLARRDEDPCGLRRLSNITLYLSILILGISTSRNGPPVEDVVVLVVVVVVVVIEGIEPTEGPELFGSSELLNDGFGEVAL